MQEKYRLKKKYQYNYIFKKGKFIPSKNLTLIFAANSSGRLKVGFSVSNKIGKAVVRNKLRRRLKEIFRARIPVVDKGYNYILLPREGAECMTFAELEKTVDYLLSKIPKKKLC